MESMFLWGISIGITKFILGLFLIEMYLLGVVVGMQNQWSLNQAIQKDRFIQSSIARIIFMLPTHYKDGLILLRHIITSVNHGEYKES